MFLLCIYNFPEIKTALRQSRLKLSRFFYVLLFNHARAEMVARESYCAAVTMARSDNNKYSGRRYRACAHTPVLSTALRSAIFYFNYANKRYHPLLAFIKNSLHWIDCARFFSSCVTIVHSARFVNYRVGNHNDVRLYIRL